MKKKQVPLRISEELYSQIASWAADDFRSVNGQIEYLLTTCVRKHRKSKHLDTSVEPLDSSENKKDSSSKNKKSK